MRLRRVGTLLAASGLTLACGDDGAGNSTTDPSTTFDGETADSIGDGDGDPGDGDGDGEAGDGDGDGDPGDGDGDGDPGDGDGDGDGDDDPVKFDVGPGNMDLPESIDQCKVSEDGNAAGPCEMVAPADSFAPVLQWSFTPDDGNHQTLTTPLVGNLTDDNDDGEIDLCDIPDVVLLAFPTAPNPGNLYVLDGATGALHFKLPQLVNWRTTPAIGDIDEDGIPEILVQSNQATIYCFEHDGTLKWESQSVGAAPHTNTGPAIALADIDVDGDIEIVFENLVLDHQGNVVLTTTASNQWSPATVAVDLDGDELMELVHPTRAFGPTDRCITTATSSVRASPRSPTWTTTTIPRSS